MPKLPGKRSLSLPIQDASILKHIDTGALLTEQRFRKLVRVLRSPTSKQLARKIYSQRLSEAASARKLANDSGAVPAVIVAAQNGSRDRKRISKLEVLSD